MSRPTPRPAFEIAGGPHVPAPTTVQGVMLQVLLALVPGVIAHVWFFGWGTAVQIVVAVVFALLFEAAMLRLRSQPVRLYLSDLSAVVAAVLFCLCVPQLMPWWVTATGMFFAIVVAKHLYGGLGHNIFNPAMVGWVVVLIAFPRDMTAWVTPVQFVDQHLGLLDTIRVIFTGSLPDALSWDAITRATPLDTLKTQKMLAMTITEIREDPIFGRFGGYGWEWIANWYAVGGLFLLYRRIISWHIPVALLGTVMLADLPVYLMDPDGYLSPLQQVFTGSVVLGAFFVATDPVSSSTTPRGRLVYAAGIALITLIIRRWGAYPDGVGFAVLLMNMAVPMIDHYTRTRIYGHPR